MTVPPIRRRAALVGTAAFLAAPAIRARESADPGVAFGDTTVRFADVESARAVLAADDDWIRATGDFQRRVLTGEREAPSRDAFRRWNGEAARAWSDEGRERWRRALESLAPRFAALQIPLPRDVLVVASSGRESASAPYTRAHAVVLPQTFAMPGYSDAMLMAHELWHVASRHAPALASRLYAEIGFEPMPRLQFPAAWADVRIANPDAPDNRHAITLQVQGRQLQATPVLVATRTELAPHETFFNVAESRLLEIEVGPAESRAVLQDGQPVWHRLDGPHDYLRRLGGNTGYVIHPEEAIADNVALLATGGRARNPDLLARLEAVLRNPRS